MFKPSLRSIQLLSGCYRNRFCTAFKRLLDIRDDVVDALNAD